MVSPLLDDDDLDPISDRSSMFQHAFALWCWYFLETERFDRGLPHVMDRGRSRVHPNHMRESMRNAASCRRRMVASMCGLPHDVFERANRAALIIAHDLTELETYAKEPAASAL